MRFESISPKQAEIFTFPHEGYDALICDGAVRSGKTVMMTVSFIMWAMNEFDGMNFAICGKTVQSTERNIITPLLGIKSMTDNYAITYTRSTHLLAIRWKGRENHFYIFGGKDESSYMLIQGVTLAGVLCDEVALMPQSFVEQAITRTLSIDNALLWFNCNPENPNHWFYREWVLKPDAHNAKHLHFLMDDNPGLTPRALEKAKRSFSGVFYDRYVRGLWVCADGLIYPMFDHDKYVIDEKDIPAIRRISFAVDVGHSNATAFLAIGEGIDRRAYIVDEYYHSGKETGVTKSPVAYAKEFIRWHKEVLDRYGLRCFEAVYVDPSALGFKAQLWELGVSYIYDANNDVVKGIQTVSSVIDNDLMRMCRKCTRLLDEFMSYAWDAKAASMGEDKPIKSNDHAMGCTRYFFHSTRSDWLGRKPRDEVKRLA